MSDCICEGKTKIILKESPGVVRVVSKDDITAGDGAKHDIIVGKAALANRTNANVFRILKECGLPVAFMEQVDDTCFLARECAMIPYEVVVRREAQGSFLERHPELSSGHVFPKLLLEFFLKTSGKNWRGTEIPVDDPYIEFSSDMKIAKLYSPKTPIYSQEPFLTLEDYPEKGIDRISKMGEIAIQTFLILEKAWQLLGMNLVDFKVEFGIDVDGNLLLADVIDNDSWRVLDGSEFLDKQLYRNGADINEVTRKYQMVADLTGRFTLPHQKIIFWCGSDKDDISQFMDYLNSYSIKSPKFSLGAVICSLHKETVRAYGILNRLVHEVPDSVIVSFVGMSNGAGPTLSAMTNNPVITVPANWENFPDDVWSSLRTPSDIPVAAILNPKNAVQAALQIFALRNPEIYALLRIKLESRLINFSRI